VWAILSLVSGIN